MSVRKAHFLIQFSYSFFFFSSSVVTNWNCAAHELSQDEIAAIAGPEMQSSLIPLYLALSLVPHTLAPSAQELQQAIYSQAPALQGHERTKQITKEVARAAGGEMHNISAVLGGMVAQEVIKVVTKQYIPVDNTCLFDGIESRCQVLLT